MEREKKLMRNIRTDIPLFTFVRIYLEIATFIFLVNRFKRRFFSKQERRNSEAKEKSYHLTGEVKHVFY